MPKLSPFVERLVKARSSRGWSQAQLADASGISATQISRYEGGVSQPRPQAIGKLASALGVDFDWLSSGVDSERAPTVSHQTKSEQNEIAAVRSVLMYSALSMSNVAAELMALETPDIKKSAAFQLLKSNLENALRVGYAPEGQDTMATLQSIADALQKMQETASKLGFPEIAAKIINARESR